MSAFVVDSKHIDYLLNAAVEWNIHSRWLKYDGTLVEHTSADEIGAKLLATNIASVNHRYQDSKHILAQPTDVEYRARFSQARICPVQVLKAIHCYEYQSCELDDWDSTPAKAFCDQLTSTAITHLPGYEAARWEIS